MQRDDYNGKKYDHHTTASNRFFCSFYHSFITEIYTFVSYKHKYLDINPALLTGVITFCTIQYEYI